MLRWLRDKSKSHNYFESKCNNNKNSNSNITIILITMLRTYTSVVCTDNGALGCNRETEDGKADIHDNQSINSNFDPGLSPLIECQHVHQHCIVLKWY